MKSSARNVKLASVDDLLSTEQERQDAGLERVQQIPLSELYPFPDHPFSVRDDDSMKETVESIKEYGVLQLSPHTPNFHTEANPISICAFAEVPTLDRRGAPSKGSPLCKLPKAKLPLCSLPQR